jgi:hypothetical protein
MKSRIRDFRWLLALGLSTLLAATLCADETRVQGSSRRAEPSAAEADETAVGGETSVNSRVRTRKATLDEVLAFARNAYAEIENNVHDYTCELYKREYVDGEVTSWQLMKASVRHERRTGDGKEIPFSVALQFLKPGSVAGRTVLYVRGRDNDDLIARRGGTRNPNMTLQLDPHGVLAMEGNRYPVTEFGFKNLAKRLIEVLEQELDYRDGELQIWENARVGTRKCTHYRLTHHTRRPNLTYHMAEVSVDDELGVPIRYGAYDFPEQEGGEPQLLEQYIFAKVRLNVGLEDRDFDPKNPVFRFRLHEVEREGSGSVARDD